MSRHFSVKQTAAANNISIRHLRRVTQELGIWPVKFYRHMSKTGGPARSFFTPEQVEQIIERKPSVMAPVSIIELTERRVPQTTPAAFTRVCIHCPHDCKDGQKCCQCGDAL